MALLSAKVDISGPLAAFQNLRREQLPWTIARALTKTAQDAQAGTRTLEGQVFKLRNDWITRNTKITAARKTSLVASVFEDARNRKGGMGDFLGDQEYGAERDGFVVWEGRPYRVIATKYLNPFGRVIPRELQAQSLLSAVNGRYTTRNRKGQIAVKDQRLVNGMVFFVVKLKSGALAICGRKPHMQEAIPFYILVTKAHLRGIFPMFPMVESIVAAKFQENFKTAALETIGNDLLRGSGLRIRL